MGHIPNRLKLIGGAIAATLALATAGYMVFEDYDFFDALYMALVTVSTVGYAEVHPLSRNGRIFNSFVILVGVSVMFLAIGAMTQTAIELQLGEFFGKRRVKRMVDRLQDHYLICGFGRVGRGAAAEMQRAGVPFVVVDRDEGKVERAIKAGMLAVLADSTRDETLKDLRIESARGLVAALATDADNLFLILSARTLNANIYISARAAEEEAEHKLRRAGASAVFAPYYLTGYRLAQAILRPHVHEFMDIFTRDIGLNVAMEQVLVDGACEFASRSLRDISLRRELGVIVLAIRKADGAMEFNPPADAVISGGDHLIVMGANDNLRKLERLLTGGNG